MLKSQWQAVQVANGQAAAQRWLTGGVHGQPAGVYRVRVAPMGPRTGVRRSAPVVVPAQQPQGQHYRG
jgi:hypothetical protein